MAWFSRELRAFDFPPLYEYDMTATETALGGGNFELKITPYSGGHRLALLYGSVRTSATGASIYVARTDANVPNRRMFFLDVAATTANTWYHFPAAAGSGSTRIVPQLVRPVYFLQDAVFLLQVDGLAQNDTVDVHVVFDASAHYNTPVISTQDNGGGTISVTTYTDNIY